MSDSEEQLKRMVMTFRVSELQMLLGYAGKNKTGRKNELQSRALDIVRMRNPSIQQKIRELYKSIQLEMMSFGDRAQAAAGGAPTAILQNQRVPSAINSIPTGYSQSASVGGNIGVTVNSSGYSSRSSSAAQVSQMGTNMGYTSIQASHNNSYPINPDVRLKKLPFYDILGELLKPSTLAPSGSARYHEGTFQFSLTPQQANKIAHSRDLRPGKQDYTVQVQMRFCLLETTCEQEDNFPPNITVKINDKICPLPSPIPTNKQGVEPKRPSRPVNVTALCRISPTVTNRILVTWSPDYGRCYVISAYLVQKLTSEDLLQRLKSKGPRLADFTKSLIKQKLREDGECEIATTSLRCSLLCPLGKMRMVLPCRAETCNHLQCFDASLFLQMNERKPTWVCPVCDKGALYDHLVIDGYFQEVLQQNDNCTEVTLQTDGGWTPLIPKKEPKEQPQEKRKSEVAIETLSDDSDDSDDNASNSKQDNEDASDGIVEEARTKRKAADVEIITLSDSDDDGLGPPSKRPAYQSSTGSAVSNSESPTAASTGTTNGGGAVNSSGVISSSGISGSLGDGNTPDIRLDPLAPDYPVPGAVGSSSNSGGLVIPNNGASHSATSPGSSGSTSPQVICLDSPASSPIPSPYPMAQEETSAATSTPVVSPPPATTPTTTLSSTPPLSTPASVAASLASLGSELTPINSSPTIPLGSQTIPASITQVQSSSLSPTDNMSPAAASGNAFSVIQDPLSSPNYNMSPLSSSSYNLPAGLQNIFNNPLPSSSPTPSASNINFRPHERFM